jgi:hypothetical protein
VDERRVDGYGEGCEEAGWAAVDASPEQVDDDD